MDTSCRCCGMVPVWFGNRSWCLCEPSPAGVHLVAFEGRHECAAWRAGHRHDFVRAEAYDPAAGTYDQRYLVCAECCGQAVRIAA